MQVRWLLAMGLVLTLVGCTDRRADLLFVYSGDCQGYLDPCG